jgi:branched-chain amino acid transport system substrate-binding protein
VEHLAAGQPDLIVGIGSYREDVWLVRALAATRPEITALALVATPMHLFWEELGEAAEGCIGPSQWEPHAQGQPVVGPTSAEFIARFQRRFGAPPDYPSAQAYAAGLVLEHCVAQAGTWTDAALRDQACELDCQTFYGRFRLASETGAQTGHETVLVQWQRGAKRLIWPRAMADAAPVCPKPWVTPLEPGPGAS